ncbi:hypothetical protein D3C71_2049340 [compost metagenome]
MVHRAFVGRQQLAQRATKVVFQVLQAFGVAGFGKGPRVHDACEKLGVACNATVHQVFQAGGRGLGS